MVGLTRQQAMYLQIEKKEARKRDLEFILQTAYKTCPHVEIVDLTFRQQIEFHPFRTKHIIEILRYDATDLIVDTEEIDFVYEEVNAYLKNKYTIYFPDCKIKDLSLDRHILRYALELQL